MGTESLSRQARESGVDGVLTVDYPPEECGEFVRLLKENGIDPIFLLSPTTELPRVETIVALASGFVYYVSLKGVTGAQNLDIDEVSRKVASIRQQTNLPIGVGFGVRDAATARIIAGFADAVVVGSRMVQAIEQSTESNVVAHLGRLAAELRTAIDSQLKGLKHELVTETSSPQDQAQRSAAPRKIVPEGLWSKCPTCESVLYRTDLEKNQEVCPKCGHHNRISARTRLDFMLDPEGRFEIGAEVVPIDPLKFKDSKRYVDRIKSTQTEVGETDALIVMQGSIKRSRWWWRHSSSNSWAARWVRW